MGLECLEVSLCLYEYAGVKKKKKNESIAPLFIGGF
jgi:hypothetical protein